VDDAAVPEPSLADPRLDAFDLTARARQAYGADGRLPPPHTANWPIFPFEPDDVRVRHVEDPVVPEPPRHGEDAADCRTCRGRDGAFVWTDDRWLVGMPDEAQSLPTVTLHTREHLDVHELSDDLGAEMGLLLVRLQRALMSIEGVGRVHVYKWGDGGAHLHIILVARPLGMMQLRGLFLTTWMHVLPPLPADVWAAIRAHMATALSTASGNSGLTPDP